MGNQKTSIDLCTLNEICNLNMIQKLYVIFYDILIKHLVAKRDYIKKMSKLLMNSDIYLLGMKINFYLYLDFFSKTMHNILLLWDIC